MFHLNKSVNKVKETLMFRPDKALREFVPFRDYHWPRFLFNLNPKNLWYNVPNLYDLPRMRTAREDITHSYANLFVEGWRAGAYLMGHLLCWASVLFLLTLLLTIVWP